MGKERPRGIQGQRLDRRVDDRGWTTPRRQEARSGHAVVRPEPSIRLQFQSDVNSALLAGGDEMVEPLQGLGVERLGVVSVVVEETSIRAQGGVEVAEPDQIDS